MFINYLNWAGLVPLTWRGYLASWFAPELAGNMLLPRWAKRIEALREQVAEWLGCTPAQVAFLPSTSVALNVASQSLNWTPDDTVVYGSRDFAANVIPWQQLGKRFGVAGRGIDDWFAEDVLSEPKTRMVSISTVDYSTGIELPWRKVVSEARARNVWTCVDAIQSAGVKPSWNPDIDFWCCGTQKWLGSGLGMGLMVVSDRVLQQLTPPFPTWLALNDPPALSSGFSSTARAWEMGWVTPSAVSRLGRNLQHFKSMGWHYVSDQVKLRRDYLHEALLSMGWRVVSCPQRWSGIVSFDPGAGNAELIKQDGYKRWIITATRGQYLRLSPHVFTSMRQLRKAVDWLWSCKLKYSTQA